LVTANSVKVALSTEVPDNDAT